MKNVIKRMFAAAKNEENVLDLYMYDQIGAGWFDDGVTPQSVADKIKEAGKVSSITVHLNSPGGASFDGVAIHNLLRQQKVPVNVRVEGLAASAAFTIAMAGDTIEVCDGAMMMLHHAWSFVAGNAKDMRAEADVLDKVSGTLRDIYSKRSGLSTEEVQELMDGDGDGTWLTPDEAVEKGFATAKLDTTPDGAQALAKQFNLTKLYNKVPDQFKPQANEDCMCECEACQNGECENCMNAECTDMNCVPEHGPDFPASKKEPPAPEPQQESREVVRARKLRYLELLEKQ